VALGDVHDISLIDPSAKANSRDEFWDLVRADIGLDSGDDEDALRGEGDSTSRAHRQVLMVHFYASGVKRVDSELACALSTSNHPMGQ